MVGENSGNVQLAGFTIMRHPEDVWLSDLSVITQPRNLQIWRHSIHLHSGSCVLFCINSKTLHGRPALCPKTRTVNVTVFLNQMIEGRGHYLPQRRCTGTGQGVPLWSGCPAWERRGLEQRTEPRVRPLQELEDSKKKTNKTESMTGLVVKLLIKWGWKNKLYTNANVTILISVASPTR